MYLREIPFKAVWLMLLITLKKQCSEITTRDSYSLIASSLFSYCQSVEIISLSGENTFIIFKSDTSNSNNGLPWNDPCLLTNYIYKYLCLSSKCRNFSSLKKKTEM